MKIDWDARRALYLRKLRQAAPPSGATPQQSQFSKAFEGRVRRTFGSWANAIRAAGFVPRVQGAQVSKTRVRRTFGLC
jgi:hypothetical protein